MTPEAILYREELRALVYEAAKALTDDDRIASVALIVRAVDEKGSEEPLHLYVEKISDLNPCECEGRIAKQTCTIERLRSYIEDLGRLARELSTDDTLPE